MNQMVVSAKTIIITEDNQKIMLDPGDIISIQPKNPEILLEGTAEEIEAFKREYDVENWNQEKLREFIKDLRNQESEDKITKPNETQNLQDVKPQEEETNNDKIEALQKQYDEFPDEPNEKQEEEMAKIKSEIEKLGGEIDDEDNEYDEYDMLSDDEPESNDDELSGLSIVDDPDAMFFGDEESSLGPDIDYAAAHRKMMNNLIDKGFFKETNIEDLIGDEEDL